MTLSLGLLACSGDVDCFEGDDGTGNVVASALVVPDEEDGELACLLLSVSIYPDDGNTVPLPPQSGGSSSSGLVQPPTTPALDTRPITADKPASFTLDPGNYVACFASAGNGTLCGRFAVGTARVKVTLVQYYAGDPALSIE